MSLTVYTGLPAVGKTSRLIDAMRNHQSAGGSVKLFLSSEHYELTRRPNVKPGGIMGCRTPGYNFKIDHVVDTQEAKRLLVAMQKGEMAVFDEAQFFLPEIVSAWCKAAKRGVLVLVGTPSARQLDILQKKGQEITEIKVPCQCGKADATTVIYEENLTYPTHLCADCKDSHQKEVLTDIFKEMRETDPFPGEDKSYQPFHNVDMPGWEFVREDSGARAELVKRAVERCPALVSAREQGGQKLTFLDLGCCSGFFCDAMTEYGFSSTGVDVTKRFIDWAERIAKLKGQNIDLRAEDAKKYITSSDEKIDVTATFATIQWVMTQQGYDAGIECFKHLFDRTRHICIVEMGYTLEDIYKERIPDRPREIDKNWVLDIMQEFGDFAKIEVHPAGENGIWRDVFVGFKEEPTPAHFRREFDSSSVAQISISQQSWPDSWLGSDFEVFLEAKKGLSTGTLKGWMPDRIDGESHEVRVFIEGKQVGSVVVKGNEFACEFPCQIAQGRCFGLGIQTPVLKRDTNDDDRPLAFVLTELKLQ